MMSLEEENEKRMGEVDHSKIYQETRTSKKICIKKYGSLRRQEKKKVSHRSFNIKNKKKINGLLSTRKLINSR